MIPKPIVRKLIALIGGVAIPVIAFFWAIYASGLAQNIFKHTHGLVSQVGPDAIYKKFADIYAFLGISFTILFWEKRPVVI